MNPVHGLLRDSIVWIFHNLRSSNLVGISFGALAIGNMPFAMVKKTNMIDSQLFEDPWSSNLEGVLLRVSAINSPPYFL